MHDRRPCPPGAKPKSSAKGAQSTQTIGYRLPTSTDSAQSSRYTANHRQTVFLLGGIIDPAYDSHHLLHQAGDIESNPGPANTRKTRSPKKSRYGRCNYCQGIFRNGQTPLNCSVQDCKSRCHRTNCSKISRYFTGQIQWKCHYHGGPEPPSKKATDTAVRTCAGILHKNKLIRSSQTAFECSSCKQHFHLQCTGLTRDAQAVYRNGNHPWECTACLNPVESDFSSKCEPTQDISEKPSKENSFSLKIIQWNADGLATVVSELQDRLKKQDIDVCLVQETKLRLTHRTQTIKGYGAV